MTSYFSKNDTIVPGNSTSAPLYEWEYYLDYLDPVFVDESQLKYHKYSIVIILWVSLAAFVGFLFLILNLMSLIGLLVCLHGERCPDARGRSQESAQTGSTEQPSHPICKEEITQTPASMTKRHSYEVLPEVSADGQSHTEKFTDEWEWKTFH
uniref:Melanocortin 2 receptor accessory protein n=1 Tax=Xiphophorus couchianus TaxID=32473 RepID=A0A3B5L476_9TELE